MKGKKPLSKLGIPGNFLNLIKNTYKNPTANSTLNGEKLDAILLMSKTRQECPFSSLLFNIILEVIVNEIKRKKGKKRCTDLQRKKWLSFFTNDMIRYVENPKESTTVTRKLPEQIRDYCKVSGNKVNIQKSIAV